MNTDLQDTSIKDAAIDPVTAARYGLGGALMGGSTAALVSFVHAINLARRQRKEMKPLDETDENTIVLTLPTGKKAEVTLDASLPVAVKATTKATSANKTVPAKSYRAGYYPNQSLKKANWQTLTASVLAAAGGGMLGYHIINRAYQSSLQRKLKLQEEAAKREMLDAMTGAPGKSASTWLDSTFEPPRFGKQAQIKERTNFSYLDAPFAMAALLTLLGSGASAYVTKKVLDNKLQEQEKEFKPPRVQRIVFKSAAGLEPGEEMATAEDLESVQCALGIAMDDMSGDRLLAKNAELSQMVQDAGASVSALYKWAQTDADPLISLLQNNPALRKMLQKQYMSKRPILRHFTGALDNSLIGGLADRLTYRKARGFLADTKANLASKVKPTDIRLGEKAGGFVIPSFVGSVLAEKAMKDVVDPPKKRKAVPADDEVKAEQLQEMLNNIQLSAKDPAAAAYLEANQDKIRAILARSAMTANM